VGTNCGPSDAEVIASSFVDPGHFGLIVDAYTTRIFRYLAKRVGPVLAQDLTSETFLQAFRARSTYRTDEPIALPWLYGIATNQVRAHFRSEQRRLEVLGQLGGRAALATTGDESVDDALVAAATVQHLAGAFARLSSEARDILTLVGVEGLSYEQAAAALGIPVGTVRSRLSRARQELRRSFGGDERPSAAKAAPREGTCHG
jgi:RNA polymerase sigma factor (sigma-70 family)